MATEIKADIREEIHSKELATKLDIKELNAKIETTKLELQKKLR